MKLKVSCAACGLLAVLAGVHLQGRGEAQAAQNPAGFLGKGFSEVSGWITQSAELVPADKYSYRPIGTVRTFGQQIAHVADAYAYYCGSATAGKAVEWTDAVEKAGGDKATIVA